MDFLTQPGGSLAYLLGVSRVIPKIRGTDFFFEFSEMGFLGG